jgi:hypothetical protein
MFLQSQRRDLLIHRYVAVEAAKPRGYLFSRCPRLFCNADDAAWGPDNCRSGGLPPCAIAAT